MTTYVILKHTTQSGFTSWTTDDPFNPESGVSGAGYDSAAAALADGARGLRWADFVAVDLTAMGDGALALFDLDQPSRREQANAVLQKAGADHAAALKAINEAAKPFVFLQKRENDFHYWVTDNPDDECEGYGMAGFDSVESALDSIRVEMDNTTFSLYDLTPLNLDSLNHFSDPRFVASLINSDSGEMANVMYTYFSHSGRKIEMEITRMGLGCYDFMALLEVPEPTDAQTVECAVYWVRMQAPLELALPVARQGAKAALERYLATGELPTINA